MGIFSKLNSNFETKEVAKLRASTILKGRVDDRDLDFGLALADQLDELQEDDAAGRGDTAPGAKYSRFTVKNTANARKIAACRIISACRCAGSTQCTCSACRGREDGQEDAADGGREDRRRSWQLERLMKITFLGRF